MEYERGRMIMGTGKLQRGGALKQERRRGVEIFLIFHFINLIYNQIISRAKGQCHFFSFLPCHIHISMGVTHNASLCHVIMPYHHSQSTNGQT